MKEASEKGGSGDGSNYSLNASALLGLVDGLELKERLERFRNSFFEGLA
jgi:hypothetical protein